MFFLSSANPAALSHELGHGKSLVNSIAARTPHKEKIYSPEKLRKARMDFYIHKRKQFLCSVFHTKMQAL